MGEAHDKGEDGHDARTDDGHVQVLLSRELNSTHIVMKRRIQLLRRRLRQGGDTTRLKSGPHRQRDGARLAHDHL